MNKLIAVVFLLAGINLSAQQAQFYFLDSIQAAQHIIIDKSDQYFDNVQNIEMSIQMKTQFPENASRNNVLKSYRSFLQRDVESFTYKEEYKLKAIMNRCFAAISDFNEQLLPDSILLIKTKGKHYGAGVFYTRDNCIIIPESDLNSSSSQKLEKVMMHEIAHIVSRSDKQLQQKLYTSIGFNPIPKSKALALNPEFNKHLLFNPDGVDMAWYIELEHEGESKKVVPMIHTTTDGYQSNKKRFFDYLQFDLYELKEEKKAFYILNNAPLTSKLQSTYIHATGGNTFYIIHPDEVFADNFVILMQQKPRKNFSTKGQKLLMNLESILINYKR